MKTSPMSKPGVMEQRSYQQMNRAHFPAADAFSNPSAANNYEQFLQQSSRDDIKPHPMHNAPIVPFNYMPPFDASTAASSDQQQSVDIFQQLIRNINPALLNEPQSYASQHVEFPPPPPQAQQSDGGGRASKPFKKRPIENQENGKERFYCQFPECGRSYGRIDHLNRHQTCHNQEKTFRCPSCPASFYRKDHLMKHERTHTADRISCPMCVAQFATPERLNMHIRKKHCDGV